ncbi:hypothetical protein K402DRAFT_401070, partial [Aulographum hederae CBS 113979]
MAPLNEHQAALDLGGADQLTSDGDQSDGDQDDNGGLDQDKGSPFNSKRCVVVWDNGNETQRLGGLSRKTETVKFFRKYFGKPRLAHSRHPSICYPKSNASSMPVSSLKARNVGEQIVNRFSPGTMGFGSLATYHASRFTADTWPLRWFPQQDRANHRHGQRIQQKVPGNGLVQQGGDLYADPTTRARDRTRPPAGREAARGRTVHESIPAGYSGAPQLNQVVPKSEIKATNTFPDERRFRDTKDYMLCIAYANQYERDHHHHSEALFARTTLSVTILLDPGMTAFEDGSPKMAWASVQVPENTKLLLSALHIEPGDRVVMCSTVEDAEKSLEHSGDPAFEPLTGTVLSRVDVPSMATYELLVRVNLGGGDDRKMMPVRWNPATIESPTDKPTRQGDLYIIVDGSDKPSSRIATALQRLGHSA